MAISDLVRKWWITYFEDTKDNPKQFLDFADIKYRESKKRIETNPNLLDRTKIEIIDKLKPLAEKNLKKDLDS